MASSSNRSITTSAHVSQHQHERRDETKPPSASANSSQTSPSGSSLPTSKESARDKWNRHRAQYNYDPFTLHPEPKHYSYPLVNAKELAERSTAAPKTTANATGARPREVRMLARDFIHDSLYNPTYGYFSKQAVLLPDPEPTPSHPDRPGSLLRDDVTSGTDELIEEMGLIHRGTGFDFNSIRSESEFMRLVEERYESFEQQISLLVHDKADAEKGESQVQNFTGDLRAERAERRQRRERQEQPGKMEYATSEPRTRKKEAAAHTAEGLELAQKRGRALAQAAREGQEREVQSMAAKQVWHTPTQIFRPWYGRAIARYLVAEYKLHNYPYDDLIVYEMGAGSGALAHDVLEYLEHHQPEIYTRTRYRIVEISPRLAEEQSRRLDRHIRQGRVEVINKSILDWSESVPQPCFVIALEVFDNLAHDVIRYSTEDYTPYQAVVSIDDTGDMHELFEPVIDPLIRRYLDLEQRQLRHGNRGSSAHLPAPVRHSWMHRLLPKRLRTLLTSMLPFYPNLTQRYFVPTSALVLLENLHTFFPQHRLIMSDFDALPDTVEGINAPVVQTRHDRAMVPVTTYLVLQGHFDIFFPTNFEDLRATYSQVTSQNRGMRRPHSVAISSASSSSSSSSTDEHDNSYFYPNLLLASDYSGGGQGTGPRKRKHVKVMPHADFLARYAETDRVTLRDGSNPLLGWYQNASWFLS